MPFNGSGTFIPLPAPDYPAVTGTTISSTAFNNYTTDLMANGLSKALVRDGQAAMTGNLNLGGFRATNLAAPVATSDAATLGTLAAYAALSGATFTGAVDATNFFFSGVTAATVGFSAAATSIVMRNATDASPNLMQFYINGSISMTLGSTGLTLSALTLGTALSLANGGTGATTASGARTNLGITATGADATYAFRANNLSDLASAASARTNLGLGTAATANLTSVAQLGFNLSDYPNIPGCRANLGLGSIATANVTASTSGPSGGADGDIWLRY